MLHTAELSAAVYTLTHIQHIQKMCMDQEAFFSRHVSRLIFDLATSAALRAGRAQHVHTGLYGGSHAAA